MKWYKSGNDIIGFPENDIAQEDFSQFGKERSILYNIIDMAFAMGLDLFWTLNAYCVSDMADLICRKNHMGFFEGEGRFLYCLERYNILKFADTVQDIIRFHWVLSIYLTLRKEHDLTYKEIACKYPVEDVYRVWDPLHETSESNACSKMHFKPVDACGIIINDKFYMYEHDIPLDKRYLLDKRNEAKYTTGVIYLETTFFHLTSEPNGFLSNWYPSTFVLGGTEFNCVEQYMMWKKAMTFGDTEIAGKILNEADPRTIKLLGRSVRGYVDSKWAAIRYDVVKEALMAKFSQNEDLREKLQGTTGYYAECAVNDLVWGIGLSMNDPDRIDRSRWRGQNLLGLALMEVYSALVTDGELLFPCSNRRFVK